MQEDHEARIKALEATIDALKYRLEQTSEQLLLFAIAMKVKHQNDDFLDLEIRSIHSNHQGIKAINPCNKSNRYRIKHERKIPNNPG